MKRPLLLAALMLSGSSLAHTAVKAVSPAAHATVTAPKNVQITFNEAIDLHFSTFKVYPLTVQGDRLTLNRAAATLAKQALKTRNDLEMRADQGRPLQGVSAQVVIPLKGNLPIGNYVLMWRVLSGDGHVITGQSVFSVR